jgi:putative membrane protein
MMWNCNNWITGGPYGMGKFFMGLGPFGGLLSFLVFILIIFILFKFIRSLIPIKHAISDKNDSLGILKNRFAKGEITQEEYRRMYETLK